MVFYFTTKDENNGIEYLIYMGKDKIENEELIKYGFPEDIWFHVDKYSSAHVYLRLPSNQTIKTIPPSILEDCCQLVKANSIEGNKLNNITIVYTPWYNLKKTSDMDIGQVGFHNTKEVYKYKIEKKKKEIINRLNKTKREEYPDLKILKEEYEKEERNKKKEKIKEQKLQEKEIIEIKKKEQELKNYKTIMVEEKMKSNKEIKDLKEIEDDFM